MNKLIEARLIPYFSFILGLSIATSTGLMSISYTAIAILVLFTPNFITNFKRSLTNWYVISGLLFYMVFIIALLWTHAPVYDTGKMLVRIIAYLLLPLFFLAFSINKSATLLLKGFLLGSIACCLLSIISFASGHYILYGIKDHTWVVFHGHILHNAFLAIAANFCLWGVLDNSLSKKNRLWYLLIYLIFFIDILFIVNGRTGQIMLLVMSSFIFLYRFKLKGFLFIIGMGIISLPLLYFSPAIKKGVQDYQEDNQQYKNGNSLTSVGLRYEFHEKSLELIKRSPLIGYGTGSFKSIYQSYTNFTGNRATTNPHSDWLWIGVETGLFGIAIYTLFLIFIMHYLYKLSIYYRCMGYTLLLGYILAGVHNSFFIDNVTGVAFIAIMTAIMVRGSNSKAINQSI